MKWPSKEELENLREKYPEGTIIKIIKMDDPTPVPPGTMGEVTHVDDIGNIHVDYFNYRSSLAIIPSKDKFEIIDLPAIAKRTYETVKEHFKYSFYSPRCGKTARRILDKAIKKEQMRLCNCWDGNFDKSPEASIKRIMEDFAEEVKK